MPGGDRTGPLGMGPMTGRAAGYCAGYSVPGFANPVPGRGFGRRGGRGGGRGYRNWYYATGLAGWQRAAGAYPGYVPGGMDAAPPVYTAENQVEMLKNQAEYFRGALEDINRRIEELEKEAKQE